MDNKIKLLTILLIVSICLNVLSIIRINNLEVDLEQGESRINNLSGQINAVSSQVGAMAKEQEWLLSREFAVDMEKSSAGQVYLTWTLPFEKYQRAQEP